MVDHNVCPYREYVPCNRHTVKRADVVFLSIFVCPTHGVAYCPCFSYGYRVIERWLIDVSQCLLSDGV